MELFLAAVTNIFGTAIDMVTDVGSAVLGDPILLAFTALGLAGIGIGFFKRLTSVG